MYGSIWITLQIINFRFSIVHIFCTYFSTKTIFLCNLNIIVKSLLIKLYWFQMTLYTGLLLDIKKWMEKAQILRCTFLHQYLVFFVITVALHPVPIQKLSGMVQIKTISREKLAPQFCHYFWYSSNPNIYIYVFVEL